MVYPGEGPVRRAGRLRGHQPGRPTGRHATAEAQVDRPSTQTLDSGQSSVLPLAHGDHPAATGSSVRVWQEDLVLPTYQVGAPDPNPMFYTHESYQGRRNGSTRIPCKII